MDRLDYATREVSDMHGSATLVEVSGSVDPSTIETFEKMFVTFLESQKLHILLDLSQLKYINSTGMGMMVQLVDKFTDGGGGIVLLRVPPKVMLVMEMLGLQEFFRIVDSESEGIQVLKEGASETAAADEPVAAPQLAPSQEKAQIACGHCGAKLSVSGSGAYQCVRCLSLLSVDPSMNITTYPEKNIHASELNLPANRKYFEGLRSFFRLFGPPAGIEDDGMIAVISAVESCAGYLVDEALKGKSEERVRVRVAASSKQLSISLYAAGATLPLAGADLGVVPGLADVLASVDNVRFQNLNGGNLFVIEKRV